MNGFLGTLLKVSLFMTRAFNRRGLAVLSIVIPALFVVIGCSGSSQGPISFESPAGWRIEHKKSKGIHFYSVATRDPLGGLLEFSTWPAPGGAEDIPTLVDNVTRSFLREARKSSKIGLASEEYRVDHFAGDQCQGSYVTFQLTGYRTNTTQAIFMMSLQGALWQGQFTGPSEAWTQALKVLQSVKSMTSMP